MRAKVTMLTIGLTIVLAAIPARRPSSGQQQFPPGNRRPACSCFCGGTTPEYTVFFDQADISAGKCFGGPLPADVCGRDYLNSVPPEDRPRFCAKIKDKYTSSKSSCPLLAQLAQDCQAYKDSPPETNCEKPTPWFDPSGCADVQDTQIEIDRRTATATVSMCGYVILRHKSQEFATGADPLFGPAYESAFRDTFPKKVCCNRFREAVRTGKPCDPRLDVDCDGRPNQTDANQPGDEGLPMVEPFTMKKGASIDDYRFNLLDPDFMPDSTARNSKGVGECPCKWELIKGELKCNGAVDQDGKKQHVYTATWRCPATNAEVFTTKYAPATAPCP